MWEWVLPKTLPTFTCWMQKWTELKMCRTAINRQVSWLTEMLPCCSAWKVKTQCFHGNHECCLPSVSAAPEADHQRGSIIHTLQTSPFPLLILSRCILAHSSHSPVGRTPSPTVRSKENKFHQSNLPPPVAHTARRCSPALVPTSSTSLLLLSAPTFR